MQKMRETDREAREKERGFDRVRKQAMRANPEEREKENEVNKHNNKKAKRDIERENDRLNNEKRAGDVHVGMVETPTVAQLPKHETQPAIMHFFGREPVESTSAMLDVSVKCQ
jgi:hypothetical protein